MWARPDGKLHAGSRQLHPTVRLKSGMALSPLDVSRQRLLLTFDPVVAVLAVRVLVVIIKLLLLHHGVGDELGSSLLELCTTLLVDTSGASSSGDDQVCYSCFDDDLLRCVGLLNSLLIHLHQRADAGHDQIVPFVSVDAETVWSSKMCKLLFVWLGVGRTPANSSRVSCDRCRADSFVCDVSPYCHAPKSSISFTLSTVNRPNSCVHLLNGSDVARCCHTSSC